MSVDVFRLEYARQREARPVHVNPDKLFGRHLAVLGNTGAGKSCTIAGLVRWSLEAAQEARAEGKPECQIHHSGPQW